MRLYRDHVRPWLIDLGSSHPGVQEMRRELLAQARGRVLEIGFGTGASAPMYAGVHAVIGIEPDPAMTRRAARRLGTSSVPLHVVHARAEAMPFPDGSFDTVVSVLTMCSVEALPAALAEIRRVLTAGGRLLFLEHGLAHDPRTARWQRRLTPLQRALFGCRLDLPVDRALSRAGLRLSSIERFRLARAPRIMGQMYRGVAEPPEMETSGG